MGLWGEELGHVTGFDDMVIDGSHIVLSLFSQSSNGTLEGTRFCVYFGHPFTR